ncbi:MAG: RHS repeat-associated core domain-containing protein [Clostridia bacterium]|nr:RHS repeat-associated core domain-containing protein [Clostridia bacterium]
MENNYVKKYECGELSLDLPFANTIYELPLLSFGDMRGSMTVSLVFNHEMSQTEGNPFHITDGYKLNLQKRIFLDEGDTAYFQEANGKIVQLCDNISTSDTERYTFFDDSGRIIRTTTGGYELEYPDYSKELYNSAGLITASYDKYGATVLTYGYQNGKLTSVAYRGKTVSFAYEGASLASITYGGATTTFQCRTSSLIIDHYSGVNYNLSFGSTYFSALIGGTESSATYTYSKGCVKSGNTLILSDKINGTEINRTEYTYPDLFVYPLPQACNYVEIKDNLGAKTRVQFSNKKPTYSYVIGESDAEFFNGQYLGTVNIFNTEEDLFNTQTPYTQRYCDGHRVTVADANGTYAYDTSSLGMQKGYFIVSGWAKKEESESGVLSDCTALIGGARHTLYGLTVGKWMYFAIKSAYSGNNLTFTLEDPDSAEITDLRFTFQATHAWAQDESQFIPLADAVLIPKSITNDRISASDETSVIPLNSVIFSVHTNDSDVCFFEDLLRYTAKQKKNPSNPEFYYNHSKSVVIADSTITFDNLATENQETYHLSNFDFGQRVYTNKGILTTRVRDGGTDCFLLYETFDQNGTLIRTQKLDSNLDVTSSTERGITTDYTRSGGLLTATKMREASATSYDLVTTTTYDEANSTVTKTDAAGNSTVYRVNPNWGTVDSITLPDDSVITNTYDKGKNFLIGKSFGDSWGTRTVQLGYSGSNLASLTSDTLSYTFDYDDGDLIRVNQNDSPVVEHEYTETTDQTSQTAETAQSFYPQETGAAYSTVANYDKYGRLVSANGNLTNVYSVYPTYDDATGNLTTDAQNDNANGFLAISTDDAVGEVSRYKYNDKGLLVRKVVTDTNPATQKAKELFAYDNAKRLTVHTYDGTAYERCGFNETVHGADEVDAALIKEELTYMSEQNDYQADGRVATHTYRVSDDTTGSTTVTTINAYDDYKRIASKIHTVDTHAFTRTFTYANGQLRRLNDSTGTAITYTYDSCGRIRVMNLDGRTHAYSYDAYGQLTHEDNSLLDKTFLYEYNDIGNITRVQSYPYGDPDAPSEDWTEQTFAYGTGANSDRLTSVDGKAITYNTNGEVASYDGWNYTWTNGRLTQIKATGNNATRAIINPPSKTYTFTYNAAGQRVKSEYAYILGSGGSATTGEVTSFTKNYVYDSFGRLVSETGSETLHNVGTNNSTTTFLYDGNTVVGMHYTSSKYGTNTYYFRRNLQGDVVEIYDTNGVRKVKYNYDAWGNCTVASQTTDAVLARVNPIRYRGYYYDAGTGLYYLNARYYNPQWRRFISPDDTAYLDPEAVNGLNRYAYYGNDPIDYGSMSTPIGIPIVPRIPVSPSIASGGSSAWLGTMINGFASTHRVIDKVSSYLVGSIDGLLNYTGSSRLNGFQSGLNKYSKWLLGLGVGLDIATSAYNNYNNSALSTGQKWASFGADLGYIGVTAAVSYGLGSLVTKASVALGTTAAGYALGATIGGVTIGFTGAIAIGAAVVVVGVVAGTILIAVLSNAIDNWWEQKKEEWFA